MTQVRLLSTAPLAPYDAPTNHSATASRPHPITWAFIGGAATTPICSCMVVWLIGRAARYVLAAR
jgi:hypothetical protein